MPKDTVEIIGTIGLPGECWDVRDVPGARELFDEFATAKGERLVEIMDELSFTGALRRPAEIFGCE